jgi:hypothetical protein
MPVSPGIDRADDPDQKITMAAILISTITVLAPALRHAAHQDQVTET